MRAFIENPVPPSIIEQLRVDSLIGIRVELHTEESGVEFGNIKYPWEDLLPMSEYEFRNNMKVIGNPDQVTFTLTPEREFDAAHALLMKPLASEFTYVVTQKLRVIGKSDNLIYFRNAMPIINGNTVVRATFAIRYEDDKLMMYVIRANRQLARATEIDWGLPGVSSIGTLVRDFLDSCTQTSAMPVMYTMFKGMPPALPGIDTDDEVDSNESDLARLSNLLDQGRFS